jgi:Zn-dependent protease with chaperone function
LKRRAFVALALYLGFYVTGLVLVAALLSLPWLELKYQGAVGLGGALALVGAGYLGWGLLPTRERWSEPGQELQRGAEPRLFEVLESLARAAGHPLPRHVYLVRDLTAFAGSRPRWLGLRREPILGLGLPAFVILSEAELRAVVAHEMGHHVGGDVGLGPWQYRTSRAIAAALHRLEGSNVWLHLPFQAYGRLYLKLTRPASREQETRADALAARLAGAANLGSALIAFEQHDGLWGAYLEQVVRPTLDEGFRAPLLEGYQRFVSNIEVERHRQAFAEHLQAPGAADDTHPPLRERLAALGLPCDPAPPRLMSGPGLLAGSAAYEDRLVAAELAEPERFGELRLLSWDDWGNAVLPLLWNRVVEPRRAALAGARITNLPALLADEGLSDRLRVGLNVYSAEARRRQRHAILAHWFALWLHERGLLVVSGPGATATLEREGVRVQPFEWVDRLADGRVDAAAWREQLAVVARAAPAPTA